MADFSIYQVANTHSVDRLKTWESPNVCLIVLQVSTADQRRSSPKTMISCNKKSLYLPPEMPAIHLEFTEYYFPDGKDYPSKAESVLICRKQFSKNVLSQM